MWLAICCLPASSHATYQLLKTPVKTPLFVQYNLRAMIGFFIELSIKEFTMVLQHWTAPLMVDIRGNNDFWEGEEGIWQLNFSDQYRKKVHDHWFLIWFLSDWYVIKLLNWFHNRWPTRAHRNKQKFNSESQLRGNKRKWIQTVRQQIWNTGVVIATRCRMNDFHTNICGNFWKDWRLHFWI